MSDHVVRKCISCGRRFAPVREGNVECNQCDDQRQSKTRQPISFEDVERQFNEDLGDLL